MRTTNISIIPGRFVNAVVAFSSLDFDECTTDRHSCRQHGLCVNKYGGYDCDCDAGYSGQYCHQGTHENLTRIVYMYVSLLGSRTCGWLFSTGMTG